MVNTIQISSRGELANYYHQSLGSPTMLSMLNALKNHPDELLSMLGMNKDLITKHLQPSTATAKGHMVRVRKNIRSTHSNRPEIPEARQDVDNMASADLPDAFSGQYILHIGPNLFLQYACLPTRVC